MVLLIPVGLYAGICLLMVLFQHRLAYFPEREIEATPADAGLDYRDVFFPATDGVRLHGWFLPGDRPGRVVLFCHGNAGNISQRITSVRLYRSTGFAVFIFDYRGYGRSEGRPGERGTYADAGGAWTYLTEVEGFAPDQIVLLGRSLGGAVAVELASRVRPRALIAEATFSSGADLAARAYPWLPVRWLLRYRYDSRSRVGGIACPKLFIHSRDDNVVPFDLGRRLYEAAAPPKQFLEIRGGHSDGFLVTGDRYRDAVGAFLDGTGE